MIGCYSKISTQKGKANSQNGEIYAGGVKNLLLLEKEKLIVGAGDGTVELIEIIKASKLTAKITKALVIPAIMTVSMCEFSKKFEIITKFVFFFHNFYFTYSYIFFYVKEIIYYFNIFF